jgi:hypothetical protein
MTPILASNFGNLYTFVTGVPALLLFVILGVAGVALRLRVLSIASASLCIGVGVWFLVSLPHAVEADRLLTVVFGIGAIFVGGALALAKRTPRPKKEADPAGTDNSGAAPRRV